MGSTNFVGTVTQIPTAWANEVNRIVYDVLGAPADLSALQTALGLRPVLDGGPLRTTGGIIENTPIGASQPNAGTFTRVRVTGSNSSATDVVTHGQLLSALNGATNSLDDMSTQNSGAVDITGGAINGTTIGSAVRAAGDFTTLRSNDPLVNRDAVTLGYLNTRWATLPNFGTMASQNAATVNVLGGNINGTVIGDVDPVEAWFTHVNMDRLLGPYCQVWFNGGAPTGAGYGLLFDLLSNAALDLGFRTKAGSSVIFTSPDGEMVFAGGRLTLNTTDDGINALQVGGDIVADHLLLNNLLPTAANHAATKNYVDLRETAIVAQIQPAVDAAVLALGSLAHQNSGAVTITGGAINGAVIGGLVPALATFTQVTTPLVTGAHGSLLLNGTGGLANSGATLSASNSTRPNVSVVVNTGGRFAVMAGATAVLSAYASGATVVGTGVDDGLNEFQVYGDAIVNGRMTFNGGTMTGSVTPSLGTAAPALAGSGAPLWARIRIETVSGPVECVIPAFPVL